MIKGCKNSQQALILPTTGTSLNEAIAALTALIWRRAHLEYEICEDERIAAHFGNKTALLQQTLASHHAALALNSDNLDIQFNTAQVTGSLAEHLLGEGEEVAMENSARQMLEEAADLFTNCLVAQQRQYEEMASELVNLQNEETGDANVEMDAPVEVHTSKDTDTSSLASSAAREGATVDEAVTRDVIF